ncbi:MAG: tRNA (N6-isopentenyl adenosine(37)-C2)-methylthiotransferase MiaB [Candidatus Nanopelagicaceae bacterium]
MSAKSYFVETYGCQMNAHDSERIAGLLEEAGMVPVQLGTDADVIVFNTCAVRENADNKLYGNLTHLANLKKTKPNLQIAVGGCMAQKDKEVIIQRAPYVDVVFGTHNVGSLPILLERARIEKQAQVEIKEALEHFPSTLPSKRFSAFSAWVSISVGCNNTCTFCIVPQLRGNEKDRDAKYVVSEARTLVEQGVIEITLLGQNVNAYGVDVGDRGAFAKLLREVGSIDGLERLRFMSPHPRDFTDDVLETMAEVPTLMPHLHMPLQSGSDRILQAMRRSYRTDRYLGILERARKAIPGVQITTDIIVGFPGETDEDHQATMDLCTQAQFAAAYTYQYSKRPNTPAATMPNQVSAEDVKRRYDALHAHQNAICLEVNKRSIGNDYVALVVDNHEGRVTGRIEDNRLVHFDSSARPGDLAAVKITAAENHYLTGVGGQVTETKGGDVFNQKASTMLGIPKLFNSKKP